MQKRSNFYFKYPPNIHELDLATMVNMYRSRGEPRKASAGEYLACNETGILLKEAKWWFGIYYSQKIWDQLLTKSCEGYPLTDVEMNILGMVFVSEDDLPHREYIERNSGVTDKLSYLIINDLRTFDFLQEDDGGFLKITPRGEKALHGVARRIYEKRFLPEMLPTFAPADIPKIEQARKEDQEQTSLF